MAFVLDASVTMIWCFANEATPHSQSVLNMLLSAYAEITAFWAVEVTNVLAVNERGKRITSLGSEEFLQTLRNVLMCCTHWHRYRCLLRQLY